jgi:ribose transport system permease protein
MFVRLILTWNQEGSNPIMLGILAAVCCIAFGCLSGLALGIIHVKLKVPSFIASVGFMSVWQSTALLITQNPESIPKALWPIVNWYKSTVFGVVGIPLIIAVLILLLIWVLTKYTPFGKAIYAIGGNERAARIAGIDVDKNKIIVFTVNGMLAALGGIMLVGSLRSSAPTIGDPYTLQIVASCALGGTALTGGKGSVLGTILGVFTVALINNGMTFVGVDAYWQNVVFGAFVLGAIALTVDRKTRGLAVK